MFDIISVISEIRMHFRVETLFLLLVNLLNKAWLLLINTDLMPEQIMYTVTT